MKDPQSLSSVARFHQTFKHPVLPDPAIPSPSRCQLRLSLISEELQELEEAIQKQDLVEVADALCDIQYVLSGAILEFGLAEKFHALFEEVQRSNMSKACKNEKEAKETVSYYKNNGTDCYYVPADDVFLVYRSSDNKTLKSIHYSPADLASILQNS
ncbi:pyrophosphohydrolase domain-containing protein [Cyclobacterium roseum]|uniref:nucleoside triphosphate pyrophosphohydrolase family protein n=1 Tax=Cyclobacterium roseum TaxID=2666137 RepID=UPI0013917036|nr:nucleoside triphosphate pyrophosphohydrolase family protein [Cyclobacterium roseum]